MNAVKAAVKAAVAAAASVRTLFTAW